mmetsp:Transcript_20408/g.17720  ORF Transcript_20408/g.17720 Transcript_20408/m.17720 type:complete len:129 (-) Transcript_20408:582-968(-)
MFGVVNILRIVLSWLLLNHLFACCFIILGKNSRFEDSWLAKLPAPQDGWPSSIAQRSEVSDWTIYNSALYWSYVTTSHIGIGDIAAANVTERAYSIVIILIGTFMFLEVFGNIVPIAEKLVSKLKLEF